MGKFITTDMAFTDTTRPRIVPSLGVTGYTKRWYAPALSGTSGDAVASWLATDQATALTQSTAGQRPTIYDDATLAVRCLRFDGTDDLLNVAGLTAATSKTVFLAFRARGNWSTGNQGLLGFTGAGAYRGDSSNKLIVFYSNGTAGGDVNVDRLTKVAAPGTGSGVQPNLAVNDDKFHVLVMRSTDGNALSTVGRQGASGYGPIDVLDLVAYPTVLSDADVTTVLTAEKVTFGAALAYT